MRKHIIVEGMDGSGKDTLIAELEKLFPQHRKHARASTSLGGPVADLATWTALDVRTMADQPPSIYNRHPLVSEPIYADYRGVNPGLKAPWTNLTWVHTYRRLASQHAVMVICHPPYSVLESNLERSGASSHMPGVLANRLELYKHYGAVVWPGPSVRYNYISAEPQTVADLIRRAYDWSPDL
jgi:hypothetical protein